MTRDGKFTFDVRERHGEHHVVLASIDGKPIFGVPVYSSSDREKVCTVMEAICGGLLSKVEGAAEEAARHG